MSGEAFITPSVVRWARTRANLSTAEAAAKVHVKTERFEDWENQSRRPTLAQAINLARALHVPLGYLFLSEPPTEVLDLPDFRTLGDQQIVGASSELYDTVHDVLRKQEWFREYLIADGAEPLRFVASVSPQADPEQVGEHLSQQLDVANKVRAEAATWEDSLRLLTRQVERLGVLVFRNGVVGNNTHRSLNVAEFRGFSLSDPMAPAVFVNAKDSVAAQSFTLIHELAHVATGTSGVSNPDYFVPNDQLPVSIERFCNRVAAATLVPRGDFLANWSDDQEPPENVVRLSRRYKVSRFVVLRRSLDLQIVSYDTFKELYEQFISTSAPSSGDEDSGGNFYATLFVRNSALFTTTLMSSLAEGGTLYRDAARLLSVRVGLLEEIAKRTGSG